MCPGGDNGVNDCEHRNRVDGSVGFVTSVFGMTAAATAVKLLLGLPTGAELARPDAAADDAPADHAHSDDELASAP